MLTFCALALCAFTASGEVLDVEEIVIENEPAVVVLLGNRPNGAEVQSSGCLVSTAGHILTTAHQVVGANNLRGMLRDGKEFPLALIEVDAKREIALLKADQPLPHAARVGDASGLRSGSPLISIAAPRNLNFSTVSGIVSSANRTYNGYPVIQADLKAAPGSSGGPVFDRDGALVGMIIGKLREEAFTVVNPVNNAYAVLKKHGVLEGAAAAVAAEEMPGDLKAAPGASLVEQRAVNAYNRGVRAASIEEKKRSYTTAVTLLPAFFEAWFNLAVTNATAGALAEAEQAYVKAAELRPDAVQVPRNLGRLYLRGDAPEKAAAAFEKAAALAPEDPQSHNDLGEARRQQGNGALAAAAFEKALKLNPEYLPALYNLGLVLAKSGETARARGYFERYLALAPDASDAAQVRTWLEELEVEPAADNE